MGSVKEALRSVAYRSGVLGLAHRLRNRRCLTTFMFHRVLPAGSAEYACAEREFTFSTTGFGKCLDFIKRHYNVVTHQAVKDHLSGTRPLPDRAGLITFDDGWRDTLQYALPELRKRALPALLFLTTDVLDSTHDEWWQDRLVAVLAGGNGLESVERGLGIAGADDVPRATRTRRITAALAEMDDERRHAVLAQGVQRSPLCRQMLTRSDLPSLAPLVAIAGHGHSHAPLSHHSKPRMDIEACHARLTELDADNWAISLPHGAYGADTLDHVRAAGFAVCYSSDPALADTRAPFSAARPLGRIHVPENEWTCDNQGIAEAKLATFLFFRPIE